MKDFPAPPRRGPTDSERTHYERIRDVGEFGLIRRIGSLGAEGLAFSLEGDPGAGRRRGLFLFPVRVFRDPRHVLTPR